MGEMGNASLDGADGADGVDGVDEVDEAMIPSPYLPYLPYLPYYPQNSTSISEINFLLEVIRYNARRISRRWAVHEVLLIAKIIR